MKKILLKVLVLMTAMLISVETFAKSEFEKDTIVTSAGSLEITFVGHASLFLNWNNKVIHIDPYGALAKYEELPKADLILITHQHQDHLDKKAIEQIKKDTTKIILPEISFNQLKSGEIIKNGEEKSFENLKIEAIPAYNIVHKRENGIPFHPKGEGNGYILTFGDKKILIAGDTENIPEIKELKNIDCAFLPMNIPYTMTPEMVADAANAFKPKVLYPYHFGKTDVNKLLELLKNNKEIEIKIRKME